MNINKKNQEESNENDRILFSKHACTHARKEKGEEDKEAGRVVASRNALPFASSVAERSPSERGNGARIIAHTM